MMKKHSSCYFFCGDNYIYVHVGLYILVELSLLATFVGGSESSKEWKFQGAKVPGCESSMEWKFQGAKVPGSESSTPGTFAPGSEWSWERKVHNSRQTDRQT